MPRATHSSLARGPRVLLRELMAEDEDEFLRLALLSRRLHYPWVSAPSTRQSYRQYLARVGPDYKALAACRREDGALVGVINLSQIYFGNFRSAYLGYYAFAPYARQHYMTEALGLVLRYAFRTLKLHRLEANIQPGNESSLRLVQRCGFVREGFSPAYLKLGGRWRDHERWAIRTEIWPASSAVSGPRTPRTGQRRPGAPRSRP